MPTSKASACRARAYPLAHGGAGFGLDPPYAIERALQLGEYGRGAEQPSPAGR